MKRNVISVLQTLGFSVLLSITLILPSFASVPVFSKVIFFGDSLSDVGDNTSSPTGQATETNKVPNENGGYSRGEVWSQPFVRYLYSKGLLASQKAATIVPSKWFDENIQVDPNNSVDFAYSGDITGGYRIGMASNPKYVLYHLANHLTNGSNAVESSSCQPGALPTNSTVANSLCGADNRVHDYIQNHQVDPSALYVIWVGPNDIQQQLGGDMLNYIEAYPNPAYTDDGQQITPTFLKYRGADVVNQALANILDAVNTLANSGAKYFMVINLPNLKFTPQGYMLENINSQLSPAAVDAMYDSLTNDPNGGFNPILRRMLSNAATLKNITIIQPDINNMFTIIHTGVTKAFPASSTAVNTSAVLPWGETCCLNQLNEFFPGMYHPDYNPAQCEPSDASLCSGPMPILPNGKGHYVFFNMIHPTTCAHKYIAKYIGQNVVKYFDPNAPLSDISTWDLCSESSQ